MDPFTINFFLPRHNEFCTGLVAEIAPREPRRTRVPMHRRTLGRSPGSCHARCVLLMGENNAEVGPAASHASKAWRLAPIYRVRSVVLRNWPSPVLANAATQASLGILAFFAASGQ